MPKLVAGWVLGTHDFLIVRVQVSLFVFIYNFTSLAELVQRLPSKQKFIGSSPIICLKFNYMLLIVIN